MPGTFVQQKQGSNTGSSSSFISGSITSTAGNSLALIVTYFGATTTVTPDPTNIFGTWVEDVSLRHAAAGGVGMHVFTMDSCSAASSALTVNFGAARTNRGIYYVEMSGIDHYISGMFPAYQVAPGATNDAITSGSFNVSAFPNYLLGFAWDQTGGAVTPSVGGAASTIFASQGTGWLMGDSVNDARLMDGRAVANGNVAATFTSSIGAADTFAALLLAFAESTSTYTLMSQCMY